MSPLSIRFKLCPGYLLSFVQIKEIPKERPQVPLGPSRRYRWPLKRVPLGYLTSTLDKFTADYITPTRALTQNMRSPSSDNFNWSPNFCAFVGNLLVSQTVGLFRNTKAISYCSYAENSCRIFSFFVFCGFGLIWRWPISHTVLGKVCIFLNISMYVFCLFADMLMLYKQRRPLLFANYSVCHNSLFCVLINPIYHTWTNRAYESLSSFCVGSNWRYKSWTFFRFVGSKKRGQVWMTTKTK